MSEHLERVLNGFTVLFDACDLEVFESAKWWVGQSRGYRSVRAPIRVNGKMKMVAFARLVMGAKEGQVVDHANRNPLDNRRSNLRICIKKENIRNSGPRDGRPFKGTSYTVHSGKWRAEIKVDGKHYRCGAFETQAEAARAYNALSREYHGEFAFQNDLSSQSPLLQKIAELEASVNQLAGDVRAVVSDYNDELSKRRELEEKLREVGK